MWRVYLSVLDQSTVRSKRKYKRELVYSGETPGDGLSLSAKATRTKPKYLQCNSFEYWQKVIIQEPEWVLWEILVMLNFEGT